MIYSMTGYGRASELLHGREITVEVKSVNHRYLETAIRMPRAFSHLEQSVRDMLTARLNRGKVDIGVSVINREAADTAVAPNVELAREYYDAVERIAAELSLKNNLTADTLARFADIFTVTKAEFDESEVTNDIKAVVCAALDSFCAMRAAEGVRLREDISQRARAIEELLTEVEAQAAGNQQRYFDRIYKRMCEVLSSADVDGQRILQEAAIFADRAAVDEETVRLRSHIAQLRGFLDAEEPIGKKMDFLVQEFNREVNTIGSKANNLETTRLIVELKAQIEKIREQVQNIE